MKRELIFDILYWATAVAWSVALLLLVGCATTDPVIGQLRQRAADAYDDALDAAERVQCQDASIGSIRRRFGQSQSQMDLYNAWCGQRGVLDLTKE